jgi:hypothetical protein
VVSERFVQLANRAMSASPIPSASCTTATGFPRKGSLEKTSTWLNFGMDRSHHQGPVLPSTGGSPVSMRRLHGSASGSKELT